ncbi:MAG TPA: SigB/SigF/SigG family RNA polymerase sigma factor [Acidimicrobiia bacterium]|nr:SigB/SigF/SigG family RNA polymerase sigma factor [Acidimicrobiia bacterium]
MTDHDEVGELIARHREGDARAQAELVERHQGLVRYLARRFAGKGEPIEDLEQVASIGLLKTIERFDPERGVQFSTYASATIIGELKRHLRDRAWSMRVPRGLKQASLRLGRIEQELTQRLGRSPRISELAGAAEMSEEDVIEALDAGGTYSLTSLDAPIGGDDQSRTRIDELEAGDDYIGLADRLATVADAIEALPERQRRILYLRFYEDMTQTEIAEVVGVSQMHVSRLLSKSFDAIRSWMEAMETPD